MLPDAADLSGHQNHYFWLQGSLPHDGRGCDGGRSSGNNPPKLAKCLKVLVEEIEVRLSSVLSAIFKVSPAAPVAPSSWSFKSKSYMWNK